MRSFERSRDERSARRAAFAPIESFEGGVEEFLELIPSRRRNSAFSASKDSTRATNPTTSAASSSYEGCGGSGADTTQMIDDQRPTIEPDTPSPSTDVLSHQDRPSTTAQLNRTREWTPLLDADEDDIVAVVLGEGRDELATLLPLLGLELFDRRSLNQTLAQQAIWARSAA